MTRATRALAIALTLCLCSTAAAQVSAYGAAARVNGVEITNAMLEKNFEEYQRENNVNIAGIRYPDRVKNMKLEVLEELIDQELVWQVVQEKDLYASPEDVDRSLQQLRSQFDSEDEFLTRITIEGFTSEGYREHVGRMASASLYMQSISETAAVTIDEMHDFYTDNPDKFEIPEMVRARHILLKVHPNANEEMRGKVHDRMNAIIAELEAGAEFAALAAMYSEDGSKSAGGDLDYFNRGEMVEPFAEAAFATEVGEVTGVVETIYGLHIIKVEDRQPSQIVPEKTAQQQIYDYLLDVNRRQAIRDELAALRTDADIKILIPLW
jgi:peptidyl-prolyl cis-trans isomerase C